MQEPAGKFKSNGWRLTVASAVTIAASGAVQAAQPVAHILHHESIVITAQKTATVERVSFEAFGKRFDVLLEPNERIHHPSDVVPLRGTLEGLAGSWARLTRSAGGRYQGVIADGQEIYAIESAVDISAMAVQPLRKFDATAVIYRLADLMIEGGPAFCKALPANEKSTGLDAFKSLGAEMQASVAVAKQLIVGVVGDYEFTSSFNPALTTPTQAVITRMNIVDGIFSEQVGVTIEVPTVQLFSTAADPFTQFDSEALLDETRQFRRDSTEQASRGLTHLMTGRDLTGDTVGIAYLGTVCGGEYAVSLSESAHSTTLAALIAAHEIGHNFNAPHDGEGTCAAETQNFLMAPRLNGSDEFSACSLQQMAPKVSTAHCLTAYSPADASIEASTSVQGTTNAATTLTFSVRSIGGSTTQDVSVTATLPTALTVDSSTASGGSCSSGAGTVSCAFGALEPDAAREVSLRITSQTAGTFPVDLSLAASNDSVSSNNTGQVAVVIATASSNPGQTSNATGGGGALGFGTLFALGGFSIGRRWRRARR